MSESQNLGEPESIAPSNPGSSPPRCRRHGSPSCKRVIGNAKRHAKSPDDRPMKENGEMRVSRSFARPRPGRVSAPPIPGKSDRGRPPLSLSHHLLLCIRPSLYYSTPSFDGVAAVTIPFAMTVFGVIISKSSGRRSDRRPVARNVC